MATIVQTEPKEGQYWNKELKKWTYTPAADIEKTLSQGGTVDAPTMIGVKFDYTPKVPTVPNSPASWVQEEQNKYQATRTPGTLEVPKTDYTSEYAIRAAEISKYERNKLLKDYYTKNKMQFDPNAFPESPEAEAEFFLNQQKEQKSYLEQQVEATKSKAARQFEGTSAGVTALNAQGREGVVSAGNALIAPQAIAEMEKDRQMQIARLDQSVANLKEQQRLQQQSFDEGRQQEISFLEANIAKQQAALLDAETKRTSEQRLTAAEARQNRTAEYDTIKDIDLSQMTDVQMTELINQLPSLDPQLVQLKRENDLSKRQTQENKDKVAMQKEYLNMIDTNIKYGVEMSPQAILQYASLSGLPVDTLLSYNEAAKQVKEMKGVDEATKQAQLDKLKNDLNRTIQGLDNADIEKFTYFAKLKAAGADKELLSDFMRIAGIKDPNDPYNLKQIENIESIIRERDGTSLSGKDVTGMEKDIGKTGGQCGRYVNNFLGTKTFGDSYQSKVAKINSQTPVVGGAFIYPPTKNNPYGHVGIVKSVNPDGTITAIDSNWNLDEKITEHNIPMNSITGYYAPKTVTKKTDYESEFNKLYESLKSGVIDREQLFSQMRSYGKTPQEKTEINTFLADKADKMKSPGDIFEWIIPRFQYPELREQVKEKEKSVTEVRTEDMISNPQDNFLYRAYKAGKIPQENLTAFIAEEYPTMTSEQRQRFADSITSN